MGGRRNFINANRTGPVRAGDIRLCGNIIRLAVRVVAFLLAGNRQLTLIRQR
jgi:hypothetical protein